MYLYASQSQTTTNPPYLTASVTLCRKIIQSLGFSSYRHTIPHYGLVLVFLIGMVPLVSSQTRLPTHSSSTNSLNVNTMSSPLDATRNNHQSVSSTTAISAAPNNATVDSCDVSQTGCTNDTYLGFQAMYAGGENLTTSENTTHLEGYFSFFQNILQKFNCRTGDEGNETNGKTDFNSYSYKTQCSACLTKYQQWLYSSSSIYHSPNGTHKPCRIRICHSVKSACPYIHPDDEENTTYSSEPAFLCISGSFAKDDAFCYFFRNTEDDSASIGDCLDDTGDSICVLRTSNSSASSPHSSLKTLAWSLLILLYTLCS